MEKLNELTSIQLADFFSAFSDPSRLKIIEVLKEKELSVREIAEAVGLSESATSHQLRTLRQLQSVRTKKEGRQVYYFLDDEHVKIIFDIGKQHIIHE